MAVTLNEILKDLELDSNVACLEKESNKSYLYTITKETQKRLAILSPDAVYIFNSHPLILFYDLDKNPKDKSELHKKIWSFDDAPIVFIIEKSEVEVFNALNYVKSKGFGGLQRLSLSLEEVKERFNLWELESGQTWKWFQDNYLKSRSRNYEKRVNERLFANIKSVRNHLIDEEKLSNNQANSLILRLIFIRYLIDRKVRIDDDLLPGNPEGVNERRKSLIKLINQPIRLNELFEKLNVKFNGTLFKGIDFVLTESQASFLAGVFEGELEGKHSLFEGFFFEIFDFSVIPVELISGIYESLIDDERREEDSAIYTPSFLVDYILKDTVDEFLKINKPEDCTVFEVAVGSGIFLVQSLRRMIEKEIELNGKADKEKFGKKIKGLAEHNLYGIDINLEALKVTCFSIYIALLDYLEPADINHYRFPTLIGNSLFKENFFGKIENGELAPAEFEDVVQRVKPKFILGNPPWKSKKSDEVHKTWLSENKRTVGNFEIAQSFLLRVKDFMTPNTQTCLIVTSTMFYNVSKTTREFKKEVLTSYCIDQFFDLSAVKQTLFEHQESPASIVFFRLAEGDNYKSNIVKHRGLKVNGFFKTFKIFALEKFDQKEIIQNYFIKYPWMFKVALYGNQLDFQLITKVLHRGQSLERLLKQNHFIYGAGIVKGNPEQFKSYKDIIGKDIIENSEVGDLYSVNKRNEKITLEQSVIKSGRLDGLYSDRQILIKEQAKHWERIQISLADKPYVFKKGIFGIVSKDDPKLLNLFSFLISNLYTYYIYLISGGWGIATRPQIRWKEEFLSFPVIVPDEETKTRLIAIVDEMLSYIRNFQNKPEFSLRPDDFDPRKLPLVKENLKAINEIVNSLYGLKEYEKDLIDYVLDVSRYQFQESKQNKFLKEVDKDKQFLTKYAEVFLEEIGGLYPEEHLQVEVYPLKHFISMNFVLKDSEPQNKIIFKRESSDAKAVLQKLADNLSLQKIVNTSDPEKNLFIQKDIKGFEKDSFYIIKPNELKSWHRARAWYDLAEIKKALQDAEINSLNNSAEWV